PRTGASPYRYVEAFLLPPGSIACMYAKVKGLKALAKYGFCGASECCVSGHGQRVPAPDP
ncbi:MAG: hypothetical protein KAJ01_01920, partial [Candidatus Hydrogenedentes bacterium]|nr:hypothetical protein [Candidatus Hydrogenedentota bacterium]